MRKLNEMFQRPGNGRDGWGELEAIHADWGRRFNGLVTAGMGEAQWFRVFDGHDNGFNGLVTAGMGEAFSLDGYDRPVSFNGLVTAGMGEAWKAGGPVDQAYAFQRPGNGRDGWGVM